MYVCARRWRAASTFTHCVGGDCVRVCSAVESLRAVVSVDLGEQRALCAFGDSIWPRLACRPYLLFEELNCVASPEHLWGESVSRFIIPRTVQ